MHLIYELYFNIYVEMCLFDVVVALDVKKIEKKMFIFVFFNAKRHLPIFSDIFAVAADKFHSGPPAIYSPTRYM